MREGGSIPTVNNMWKIIIVFVLVSIIAKSHGLKCYLDTVGTPQESKVSVAVKVNGSNFKVFDCNIMKQSSSERVRSRETLVENMT